jgi:tRNA (guanine-N7-)-methyltransferase
MTARLDDAPPPGPRRPIRSFVLRQGRMSPAQQRAITTLLPHYGIAYAPAPIDFERVFGRRAPVVLEIGFGMGETTAEVARAHPASTSSVSRSTAPVSGACSGASTRWG